MSIIELIEKAKEVLSLMDEVVVFKPLEEMTKKLEEAKPRGFLIRKSSGGEFGFESNFALTSGMGDGIVGKAKLTETQGGGTRIKLTTKPQVAVWFSAIIVLVFLIAMPFIEESVPIWMILVLLIMPFWFFFIFRFQEKSLFEKMKSFLKEG